MKVTPLRVAVCSLHTVLLISVTARALNAPWWPAAAPALAIALALPLLATLAGLVRGGRRALQATAILLVPYVGWAIVEIIASEAASLPRLGFATAGAELALLLMLARRPSPPRSDGSAESSRDSAR